MATDRLPCPCGCGDIPTTGRKYVRGHDSKAVWKVIRRDYGDAEDFLAAHDPIEDDEQKDEAA